MRRCTDKVAVREFVKERIGEEYLKPVLQIIPKEPSPNGRGQGEGTINDVSTYFNQINWEKLPNAFVIKCNHGCKWQYVINNKEEYLNNPKLVEITKRQMTGWLEQEYCWWGGFEMQYKGIEPKILIEPLMRDDINTNPREIEIYCFSGVPKIYVNARYGQQREITFYKEDFSVSDLILHPDGNNLIINELADDILKQAVELSSKLRNDNPSIQPSPVGRGSSFNFVRVDWLVHNNKLYFNELTFSPYSGFIPFDKNWKLKMGNWIEL